ncbi:MAG: GNAT family N-acetyltransferase, partial [Ferruginibacter sp.]
MTTAILDDKQTRNLIKVRLLVNDDYDDIRQMQLAAFPEMKPWSAEQWEKVTIVFPEGQIGIEVGGKLAASSCAMLLHFDEFGGKHSWAEITGKGTLSTHDTEGDTLYGIEIMVYPEYQGMRLARRIYDERKKLAVTLNLKRIVVGGRLPNYHLHSNNLSVKEYVKEVTDKKKSDPVFTTQLANGFKLKRIIKDYLPSDTESCGYATFMEWVNLDYEAPDFTIPEVSNYVRV